MSIPQIVVNPADRHAHDIWIEPSATVKAEGVNCCDPQHGGSIIRGCAFVVQSMDRPLGLHDGTTAPPCAATAALQMGGDPTWHGRICLRQDAGVDDFVAAAILSGLGITSYPFTREMFDRVAQLARADNASFSDLPDWATGQKLHDVTSVFPGLARVCACKALRVERRVELCGQWLQNGDCVVMPHEPGWAELSGVFVSEVERDRLALGLTQLNLAAREDLAAGRSAMRVEVVNDAEGQPLLAVVRSTMTGLSAGRGALSYGYEHAPVSIACSPLPDGKRLVTIARASNARLVEFLWEGIRQDLLAIEAGWGGNQRSGILGSPKPDGTALAIDTVRDIVAKRCRWTPGDEETDDMDAAAFMLGQGEQS